MAALGLSACQPTAPVAPQRPGHGPQYVALGDSFASGPLIPDQVGTPGCARSSRNYAADVARSLDVSSFTDVTCGGATFADLTTEQSVPDGTNPPQLDALSADTDLVTLTMGGNDLPVLGLVSACGVISVESGGIGSPCRDLIEGRDPNLVRERLLVVADRLDAALDAIRDRSPHARILVVGLPNLVPDDGSNCFDLVPIAAGDAPWFRDLVRRFNGAQARVAQRNGATFVDVYEPSIGHDACQPTGTRWVEALEPTSEAMAGHPNADGMAAMAEAVTAVADPGPRRRHG